MREDARLRAKRCQADCGSVIFRPVIFRRTIANRKDEGKVGDQSLRRKKNRYTGWPIKNPKEGNFFIQGSKQNPKFRVFFGLLI